MESKNRKKQAVNFYLIIYNLFSAIGWSYVLFLTARTISSWKSKNDYLISKNLYHETGYYLKILLASAGLEVLHAAFRLVPSNPVVVFPQVFIRFLVIWAVADVFQSSTKTYGLFMLNLAWSISETIRYFYYVFNLLNSEPFILKVLRYNLFIILYPIGALAETILIANAAVYLKPMSVRKNYSFFLPNNLNISFDIFYLLWIWVALYLPVFPFMYNHMLAQRRKYLYGRSLSKKSN